MDFRRTAVAVGTATIAVILSEVLLYAAGAASYIHVGESRAHYNVYFRLGVAATTWFLLCVASVLGFGLPAAGEQLRRGGLRSLLTGAVVGYIAGLLGYLAMLVCMVYLDGRSFGHSFVRDPYSFVIFLALPLISLTWLLGAGAAFVNFWMMVGTRHWLGIR